jgi:hypothetical protein
MKIITNNHYRPVLHWHDLTTKEQDELKDSYDTIEESTFFRYRSRVYDLGEFMRVQLGTAFNSVVKEWDGYHNETFFSAVVVKYDNDYCDTIKVGLALS